ncbi:MAG: outer membrane beta-barrel protein [Armatimonadetes bacterium]|nr:outer membrane beta-barrel protein [Armatimonadota bacterium]
MRVTLANGLALYLVQGWNEVEDSNSGKTVGASFSGKLSDSWNATLNVVYGDEGRQTPAPNNSASFGGIGFAKPGTMKTTMVNLNLSSSKGKWLWALDGNWATADGNKWYGLAGYATTQLSPTGTLTLRLEGFRDADGVRTGMAQSFNSFTATYGSKLDEKTTLGLEFRHDMCSTPFFDGRKNQDTLGAFVIVRF